jgi:hypothetical protein
MANEISGVYIRPSLWPRTSQTLIGQNRLRGRLSAFCCLAGASHEAMCLERPCGTVGTFGFQPEDRTSIGCPGGGWPDSTDVRGRLEVANSKSGAGDQNLSFKMPQAVGNSVIA